MVVWNPSLRFTQVNGLGFQRCVRIAGLAVFCLTALSCGSSSTSSSNISGPVAGELSIQAKQALRDNAIHKARVMNLAPMTVPHINWTNPNYYESVHQYLTQQISKEQYQVTQPSTLAYFSDVYGLSDVPSTTADYTKLGGDCYFSPTLQSLSAKYFLTQEDRYLAKWLALQRDLAANERKHKQVRDLQ